MKHHTKTKGDLAVLKAQVALAEQGYTICIPLTEHAPFDLIAYKGGSFKRVQVKYRSANRGLITVQPRSTYSDKRGFHHVKIDVSQIDVYCVYCPNTDECYFFRPFKKMKCMNLRIVPTKNNQVRGIKLVSDYRLCP